MASLHLTAALATTLALGGTALALPPAAPAPSDNATQPVGQAAPDRGRALQGPFRTRLFDLLDTNRDGVVDFLELMGADVQDEAQARLEAEFRALTGDREGMTEAQLGDFLRGFAPPPAPPAPPPPEAGAETPAGDAAPAEGGTPDQDAAPAAPGG